MSNYDTSLRTYAEESRAEYVEICNCHNPERVLYFDISNRNYFGTNGCSCEFACAKLQINKHKVILTSRKKRLLDPDYGQYKKIQRNLKNPYDRTIDQFFRK